MRLARRTRQRAALAFMRWPIRFCRPLRPARCRCSGPPSNTRRSAGGRRAGTDNSAACRGRLVPHSPATNRFAESTSASSAFWHWKVNRSIRGCRCECGRCNGGDIVKELVLVPLWHSSRSFHFEQTQSPSVQFFGSLTVTSPRRRSSRRSRVRTSTEPLHTPFGTQLLSHPESPWQVRPR